MIVRVLLNLLNELRKGEIMRGLSSILLHFRNEFNKFNNTEARMLDSIYRMTLKLIKKNRIFLRKTSKFCHLIRNVIMNVIRLPYKICKPLVVYRFYFMRVLMGGGSVIYYSLKI